MFERTILSNLISNEPFSRNVIGFLKTDYFSSNEKIIFSLIQKFIEKYKVLPTKEALNIELGGLETLNEVKFKETSEILNDLSHDDKTELKFLIEQTEKFCQEKAIINALRESISIVDDPKKNKGIIPKLLQDALSVSFDFSVGHDFFDDAGIRFEEYHSIKKRLSFDIDLFNKIYDGGLLPKTLLILMAATGGGKSLSMVHFSSYNLIQGKNVLYFTMEMSEQQIGERIDHNLLGVTKSELLGMSLETYNRRLAKVREKTKGKLIIKEFASGSANANHFRYIINELRIKKNFIPDVIYIDYLNICSSSRMKMGGSINTYVLVKSIAEELRGLAQEFNVPVITATQTNREGMNSSDVDLTNTSESVGIPQTADYMLAMITSEELDELGQIMFKQLKNRYGDPTKYKKFVVGIDRSRMRLFNVEETAQMNNDNEEEDKPLMDKTKFGEEDHERNKKKSKFGTKFHGFR